MRAVTTLAAVVSTRTLCRWTPSCCAGRWAPPSAKETCTTWPCTLQSSRRATQTRRGRPYGSSTSSCCWQSRTCSRNCASQGSRRIPSQATTCHACKCAAQSRRTKIEGTTSSSRSSGRPPSPTGTTSRARTGDRSRTAASTREIAVSRASPCPHLPPSCICTALPPAMKTCSMRPRVSTSGQWVLWAALSSPATRPRCPTSPCCALDRSCRPAPWCTNCRCRHGPELASRRLRGAIRPASGFPGTASGLPVSTYPRCSVSAAPSWGGPCTALTTATPMTGPRQIWRASKYCR
mmetsp:Transcript_1391/g.3237  ORF Transcript_1391/g.3237 Transcript_1391/m.3237 type:complete len:293 (+) Transcript_1391:233-1111(+)